MAIKPTVIWTVLPKYAEGTKLVFSVFASFRLGAGGNLLSDYSLDNWPSRVLHLAATSGISAHFDALGASVPVSIDTSPLRPDIWNELFKPNTLVHPFQFEDNSIRPLFCYPAHQLHEYIEQLYTTIGNMSPSQFPDLNAPGPLRTMVDSVGHVRNSAYDITKLNKWRPGPHPDAEAEGYYQNLSSAAPLPAFYNAWRFYHRTPPEKYVSQRNPVNPADVPPPIKPPSFDFHEVIAALGDHPQLMRMLGVAIDCSIDLAAHGLSPYSTDRLRVKVGWADNAIFDQTPWTQYVIDAAGFRAQERKGTDQAQGVLLLGNEDFFQVAQMDVDGSVLKTMDFASNMKILLKKNGSSSKPNPQSLPAKQNGGITVLRKNRDTALTGAFQNQKAIDGNLAGETVFSNDVTRGYRVDMKVDGRWHSLSARQGAFNIGSLGTVKAEPDEGYIKAASATSVPDSGNTNPPDMYMHESVFGWENWSLVVPRPGNSISFDRDDTKMTQTLAIRKEPNLPPSEFPLQPQMAAVPGSLPRLRFGKKYEVRARVVDMAGNSLPNMDGDFGVNWGQTKAFEYLRYDPLSPPVLVMRQPIGLAESVEHLVIRTKVNSSLPSAFDSQFNGECLRFVAAPKSSQWMAEVHGAFDPLFNDPLKAYAVAAKEAGTFNDPTLPGVALIDIDGNKLAFPSTFKRGDPLPKSTYSIQTVSTLDLPYLPDPLAIGWVIQGFPGQPMIEQLFDGLKDWPNYKPFSLELRSGSSESWASSIFKTEVKIPKGTRVTVKMSSAIAKESLPLLARYQKFSPAMQSTVQNNLNQHWMITPWREVTFVHAVEKPLAAPVIYPKMAAYRMPGDNFVELDGVFQTAHPQSTGSIEMLANWVEYEDRLTDPAPAQEPRNASVFTREVGYDEGNALFPKGTNDERPRQEFGDTKHRVIDYTPRATTRYREYFSPELYNQIDLITESGAPLVRNIPSSARPDVPEVLYVIPTFRWEDTSHGRKRIGRGLRIYLDRPWWSSGEGELLAAILPRDNAPDDKLRRYISEWGRDPSFHGSTPNAEVTAADFIPVSGDPEDQVITNSAPLQLEELMPAAANAYEAKYEVNVAAFAPRYNADRRLHYVDIEMDAKGAYFPFVRLALARYQPDSLPHLHLSKVVRTEFSQLVADRTATLTYKSNAVKVLLSGAAPRSELGDRIAPIAALGSGGTGTGGGGGGGGEPSLQALVPSLAAGSGRLVEASIERRDSPSEDFGWVRVGNVVSLPSFVEANSTDDVVYWGGELPLPTTYLDKEHRLVIQEYELYETDSQTAETVPVMSPVPLRKRPVYTDIFPLTV